MSQYVRVRERATGTLKPNPITVAMANALRDKYEIISENEPAKEVQSVETPNLQAADVKAVAVDDAVDLANARQKYEELFGEKPHGRLQLKSLIKLNEEKSKSIANAEA